MHLVIKLIESKVTGDMNDVLMQSYTEEEIKKALNQMHPAKAPGPDGMPSLFFQKFWHITKSSFVSCC